MQIGSVSSACVCAARETAKALPMPEWRLAALLVSAGRSMRDSIGLLVTRVVAERKEAHHMHQVLALRGGVQ